MIPPSEQLPPKRNFQRELESLIKDFGETHPRLLLHSCCGPCSSSVLEFVTRYFDVTLLWFNPNIYPESEFEKRREAQVKLIRCMSLNINMLQEKYQPELYFERIRGLEGEPEGGARCQTCFRIRLERCAQLAKEQNFDFFCTTLTLSRHKNAPLINALGEEIGAHYGVRWLPSDFKKRGGELRSSQLCAQYGIYRQNYCGCKISLDLSNPEK